MHRSGFSRTEIRTGLSHLKGYCAVHLVDRNELVMPAENDTRFTVVYRDAFYRLSSAEAVAAFSADPDKYTAASLPGFLPAKRSAADVKAGFQYLINVGSVGQPRDRNPKAAYVIYDLDEQTISMRRVDYDMETTQKKIRAAGLPFRNALRLAHGR